MAADSPCFERVQLFAASYSMRKDRTVISETGGKPKLSSSKGQLLESLLLNEIGTGLNK